MNKDSYSKRKEFIGVFFLETNLVEFGDIVRSELFNGDDRTSFEDI
jgi:hypothetical protein